MHGSISSLMITGATGPAGINRDQLAAFCAELAGSTIGGVALDNAVNLLAECNALRRSRRRHLAFEAFMENHGKAVMAAFGRHPSMEEVFGV